MPDLALLPTVGKAKLPLSGGTCTRLIIMITSTQPRKTWPANWNLADVHAKINCGNYVFSSSAQRCYTNYGMDLSVACEFIKQLTDQHFSGCHRYLDGGIHDSYKAIYVWYDENEELERSDLIFVKLCINSRGLLVIERFHLDGRL